MEWLDGIWEVLGELELKDLAFLVRAAGGVVGGLVGVGIFFWFMNSIPSNADQESNCQVLRYGTIMKGMGIVGALIFLIGFVVSLFVFTEGHARWVIWVFGSFVLFYLYALPEFFLMKIEFDENEVRAFSPWRQNRKIEWQELKNLQFSHALQWWTLDTRFQGCLRLSVCLSGIPAFLEMLEEKTGMKVPE